MNDKTKKDEPKRDENGRTWFEANGPLIFGFGAFIFIAVAGILYRIATG